MNIPSNIITLLIGIAITIVSLWFGQNHGLMPVAASDDAVYVDDLFNPMMTIATGLFLLVEGALIYSLIKFRRKKGDKTDGPPIEGNVPLEIVWTAIPTVIVLILAIYSFEIYNNMGGLDPNVSTQNGMIMAHNHQQHSMKNLIALDPNQPQVALGIGESPELNQNNPLEIDVNGIQYAWLFNYKDTGIISGELRVPVDRPVKLNIRAGDVIHAFWVPELRLKQDAIPGRDVKLVFKVKREGDYPVICAELCGPYHGGMKTRLYALSEEKYALWVKENTPEQAETTETPVAMNLQPLTKGDLLSAYAQSVGINNETLEQLHHHDM